uniref:Uncharacterized protein n=1 Tax=Oryza glumipatula TaxID=40148 RepID=A0A0D9YQM4_9ORYZ
MVRMRWGCGECSNFKLTREGSGGVGVARLAGSRPRNRYRRHYQTRNPYMLATLEGASVSMSGSSHAYMAGESKGRRQSLAEQQLHQNQQPGDSKGNRKSAINEEAYSINRLNDWSMYPSLSDPSQGCCFSQAPLHQYHSRKNQSRYNLQQTYSLNPIYHLKLPIRRTQQVWQNWYLHNTNLLESNSQCILL